MLSASEIRKILDKIAVEVGIQKIDEKKYGNKIHNVFYHMLGTESYFMNLTWYDSDYWHINVADSIICNSHIWTTGNISLFPKGVDNFALKMIKERLEELITNYNKALKEMKLKEILSAGGEYDV